ncbi:MAG: hypothetical protein ACP5NW_00175 [Candidatus Woesearchaeota archaeon]
MEGYELWKKMEEARIRGQNSITLDDNGAEITIHMDDFIWYPEYY